MEFFLRNGLNRLLILFISISLFLSGCKEDELRDVNQKFERLKNSLYTVALSDNLLTDIAHNETGKSYSLSFENGEALIVPESFILSYTSDAANWRTNLILQDNSEVNLQSLGTLKIAASQIKIDPFGRAPLTAMVKVTMPVKGRFKIKVLPKDGGVVIENSFANYSNYHELPILGLYANYSNKVEISFLNEHEAVRAQDTVTLVTDKIPSVPTVKVEVNKFDLNYRGIYFPAQGKIGFDQTGEIRWYYSGDAQFILNQTKNGNLIITSATGLIQYHSPVFYEVSMVGEIVKKFNVTNYVHHDVGEKPDGNFLVVSNSTPVVYNDGNPEEDFIIEYDRKSGAIVKSWNLNQILDPSRAPLPSTRADDWLHINAVYYDDRDNSIVLSGRSQSAIAKIDYATGNLKWILASHAGWINELKPFLLTPVANNVELSGLALENFWSYGQHSPFLLPNGNIMVYDNGDHRGFYENPAAPFNSYTRAVEYKVDEVGRKVEIAREFNFAKQFFTQFTGSVSVDPSAGTTIIGLPPRILEVSASGEILFDATVGVGSMYRGFRFQFYKKD